MLNKKSNSIILFIGFSFIILGYINLFREISDEYLISISFSASFFALADLITKFNPINKIVDFLFSIFLFGGVSSFVILPPLLLTVPDSAEILLANSETLTLITFGLVMVIINIDIRNSEEKTQSDNKYN